jgi:hypothetical protein
MSEQIQHTQTAGPSPEVVATRVGAARQGFAQAINPQQAACVAAVRAAAADDNGMTGLTWEIDGSTVRASGRIPNRYGSGSALTNYHAYLSAEYLVLTMRETGMPLSTVLVAAIAQGVAAANVRNDNDLRDPEGDNLRREMQDRRIAAGESREAAIRAEGDLKAEALEAHILAHAATIARLERELAVTEQCRLTLKGRWLALEQQERVRKQQADADAARIAREKVLSGLYQFPEAGEGRWQLREIIAAFKAAHAKVGSRELRRQKDRVTLANGRLVREVIGFGQRITTGNGAHAYRVYFAPELVEAAASIVRKQVRQTRGVRVMTGECQRLHAEAV